MAHTYGKLVIATRNTGKVKEIQAMLVGLPVEVMTLADLPGVPEVIEDGLTFAENASKKARGVAAHTGLLALADDSGLEVDALGGRPGVFSARFSGPGATDRGNLEMLLELMSEVPDGGRSARFRCAVAVATPDGTVAVFEGTCEGQIGREPRGQNGFGYDPVFEVPQEGGATFAQLSQDAKSAMSHRGKALRAAGPHLRMLVLTPDSASGIVSGCRGVAQLG